MESVIKYENTIKKIPGVISTKIITDEEHFKEIHVLSNVSRNPKQISRDIQSIFAAKFDKVIDYKIISVVQIEEEDFAESSARFFIEDVAFSVNSQKMAKAEVTLSDGEITKVGKAQGINTTENGKRIIAKATIECIHNMLNIGKRIVLEDVKTVLISNKEVILVSATVILNNNEELVVGSALNKKDINNTIVKATLDALNRKISLI